tara:strand:- start:274 stop:603 length:330 start_codon:yes stop_codon:yes gene_type:complete
MATSALRDFFLALLIAICFGYPSQSYGSEELNPASGPGSCNDKISRLMQIRLNRYQESWEEENPTPSDFQLEAQYLNLVVKAESIKAHALKKYECRLKLSLPDEEVAED